MSRLETLPQEILQRISDELDGPFVWSRRPRNAVVLARVSRSMLASARKSIVRSIQWPTAKRRLKSMLRFLNQHPETRSAISSLYGGWTISDGFVNLLVSAPALRTLNLALHGHQLDSIGTALAADYHRLTLRELTIQPLIDMNPEDMPEGGTEELNAELAQGVQGSLRILSSTAETIRRLHLATSPAPSTTVDGTLDAESLPNLRDIEILGLSAQLVDSLLIRTSLDELRWGVSADDSLAVVSVAAAARVTELDLYQACGEFPTSSIARFSRLRSLDDWEIGPDASELRLLAPSLEHLGVLVVTFGQLRALTVQLDDRSLLPALSTLWLFLGSSTLGKFEFASDDENRRAILARLRATMAARGCELEVKEGDGRV